MPTHEEIARAVGVSRGYVTHQLRGTRPLTHKVVEAVAELVRQERAEKFAEIGEECLRAGDISAAEAATTAAIHTIGGQ